MGVPKKPLTLIEPQFEQPLPPLQPAVFPPAMFEPPPPALELFDLDEAFANEHFKLAQLSKKCSGATDVVCCYSKPRNKRNEWSCYHLMELTWGAVSETKTIWTICIITGVSSTLSRPCSAPACDPVASQV